MKGIRTAAVVFSAMAAATLLFWLVVHEVSALWLDVALRPEVRAVLEQSLEDQKALRSLDPERRELYRRRFEETRTLLNRIEVIRLNRESMTRRFELAMLALFAATAALAGLALWLRYRREQQLERKEYLSRMSALQGTARRQAHEIKGPLTAARLELERLADLVRDGGSHEEVRRAHESVAEELDRLARYTREFSSFAGLGTPLLRKESIRALVDDFCSTFAGAWQGMELRPSGDDATACVDRDMFRQVLVNLCSNSARAGARVVTLTVGSGSRVQVDVADDGEGVAPSLRERIFDPYVTTRRVGEGMGLGLSVSRKIMLEHGGDLALVETSRAGSLFRVVFGEEECN